MKTKWSLISLCFVATVITTVGLIGPAMAAIQITGAGSTFVYPVLSRWADTYKKETGAAINYQSIGSGGGIKQIESKTVDFGATDMPLKSDELAKNGLMQFPIVNGADVPVVHIEGVKASELKLTGEVLADIFLGKIKKWNDPAIVSLNAALNNKVKLPDQSITVVHRSDGSGTTFIFTNYLSKVSRQWQSKVGEGTAVNWPAGVGGKGNEGVASYVKQIDGSIGYIEYAYALQNQMTTVQLKNGAGFFVAPEKSTFAAAASGADWAKAENFYLILTNAPGKKSWPIAGSTFVLMQKVQRNTGQGREVVKFFRWVLKNGAATASDLFYVPLPQKVSKLVEKAWAEQIKGANATAVTTGL